MQPAEGSDGDKRLDTVDAPADPEPSPGGGSSRGDPGTASELSKGSVAGSSKSPVSIAILAAIACVPIVVAVGFLTDRESVAPGAAASPGGISLLDLRGPLDGSRERRPAQPARAGY